jgi:hypothetical protein
MRISIMAFQVRYIASLQNGEKRMAGRMRAVSWLPGSVVVKVVEFRRIVVVLVEVVVRGVR